MTKKCIGCGTTLQTESEEKEGYINEKVFEKATLCEKCFKIKHYSKSYVTKIDKDYTKILSKIKNKPLIYLIDTLYISDDIKEHLSYLKKDDIILLTKKDILPKSVKDKKLIDYVKSNFNTKSNIYVISSKKKYNIDTILKALEPKKEWYVLGNTNSGKSSFINALTSATGSTSQITVSPLPNTTTDLIKIKLNNNLTIIDTPGFINASSIYNYIDTKKHVPLTEIKPKIYNLKPNYTLLIDELIRIDNTGENIINLVFYMSNSLKFRKVKTTKNNLKTLPKKEIKLRDYEDIIINGIGFIKVVTTGNITIYTKDKSIIKTRPKLI